MLGASGTTPLLPLSSLLPTPLANPAFQRLQVEISLWSSLALRLSVAVAASDPAPSNAPACVSNRLASWRRGTRGGRLRRRTGSSPVAEAARPNSSCSQAIFSFRYCRGGVGSRSCLPSEEQEDLCPHPVPTHRYGYSRGPGDGRASGVRWQQKDQQLPPDPSGQAGDGGRGGAGCFQACGP